MLFPLFNRRHTVREMLSSKSFKKLVAVLITLIIIMSVSLFSDSSVISSILSSVTLGMQEVSATATEKASDKSYDELLKENEKLQSEVANLRTQLVDYYDTKQENARLWKYFDLKKEYPAYDMLPASVIRRDPGDNFYSFTINKGTADGIEVNAPVVTEKGLVGWVFEVDASTSRVKTILSPDAKAGAIDIESRDSGIVSGSILYADQNLTTMTKIPAQNKVMAGDIIITTGISGLYPASLIIGEVVEMGFDDYDTSTFAVIRPFEDLRSVTDVVVITSFEGQGQISDSSVEDITLATETTTAATEATTQSGVYY